MPQALFYPWIDIEDEGWLKASLLYWDSVRTIVPESIDSPYSTESGKELAKAGFLVPLRVQSGMEEIEELADDVISYLGTAEGAELLVARHGDRHHDIHVDKLPHRIGRLAEMHPEKLPQAIRYMLRDYHVSSDRGGEWLGVNDGFANFYMTLLANRLSDRVGARLVTSLSTADRLAVTARLDAQLNGLIPWGIHASPRSWREYEAFGRRRRMPRHLAPGMLASLAIERIAIAKETSVEQLIDFRTRHRDELAIFRAKIDKLAASIETDEPVEALRQRIADIYSHDVAPAITNLKAALDGRRIRWLSDGLQKIAFLSVGSSTVLAATGMPVPTALLAGAGLSLIVSGVMYNVDRRESLRQNPYTYLLSIEREFA